MMSLPGLRFLIQDLYPQEADTTTMPAETADVYLAFNHGPSKPILCSYHLLKIQIGRITCFDGRGSHNAGGRCRQVSGASTRAL